MRLTICAVWTVAMSGLALAVEGPVEAQWRGVWSTNCRDPAADSVRIEATRAIALVRSRQHVFADIEISYSFGEGAKASGRNVWLLAKPAGAPYYAFVGTLPGTGRTGPLVLDDGDPGVSDELRPLRGRKLTKCP